MGGFAKPAAWMSYEAPYLERFMKPFRRKSMKRADLRRRDVFQPYPRGHRSEGLRIDFHTKKCFARN